MELINTYSLLVDNVDDGAQLSSGRTVVDEGDTANFDKSSETLQYKTHESQQLTHTKSNNNSHPHSPHHQQIIGNTSQLHHTTQHTTFHNRDSPFFSINYKRTS
jgi:hypothetical protein